MSRSVNKSKRYTKRPRIKPATRRESEIVANTHHWCSVHRIYRKWRKFWDRELNKARRRHSKEQIRHILEPEE